MFKRGKREQKLAKIREKKMETVNSQDYELAAQCRWEERELLKELNRCVKCYRPKTRCICEKE